MALQLDYGVRQKVFITHVAGDGTFFVQLDSETAYSLPDLSQSIQTFVEGKGKSALAPEYGLKCFAFSTRDQAWYRALISGVDGSKTVVYYVDYGNTEEIPASQLNAPTDSLFESPYQAVCCSISDFIPSKSGSQKLSGFLLEKEYSGNFVSRSSERHPYLSFLPCNNLSLFEDESATESIAQQLVVGGLGQFRICTDNIKIGGKQKVYTCFHDSPGKFWVQLADCQSILDTIMDDLNDPNTVGRLKPLTAEALSPGVACCCQYSEDNRYHRAEIITKTKSPTRFKVSFVDYGNCEVVELSDIKELPARLALFPFCAIQCCLEGVTPVKQEKPDPKHGSIAWNPKACDAFVSITSEKELDALFVSEFSPEIFNVKLTDTESNSEIAYLLAQSGHANLSVEYDAAPAPADPEEYQYVNMDVGKTYKGVYVTHADSPSVVWCQLPDQVEGFNDLLDKLAECGPSLPCCQVLEENQPCCVKYSVDQNWYRGLASSVDNSSGTAKVFFVDYGNSETVDLADVRELLPDFFTLPAQAVSFSLAEMSPIGGGEWSQSAISAFQELVVDKYLNCEVVGLDDDGYPSAKLFNSLQENMDIRLELIRQNHAKAPLGSASNRPNLPTKSQEQPPQAQSNNSQVNSQAGTASHVSHSRTSSKGSNQSPFQSKKGSPAHSFSGSDKSWSRQRHPSNRSSDGSHSGRARQMGRSFSARDSSSGSSRQGSQDRSSLGGGHRPARYRRVRLQTGEAYDVCVCHVESLNEFYCQLHQNAIRLSEVMQEIDQHCSSPSARPASSPSPNTPVLARYSGDGSWYRAIVKEPPNENSCRVFFVDYGNSETVPTDNLIEMPPPLLSLESQAIQCALIGVPRDLSPPESTIDNFGELTIEKDFRFNVKKYVRDKELNVGELLCEDGSSFIDHLKEKGLLPSSSSSSRGGPTATKKSFTEFKKDSSPRSSHKGFGRDASPKSPRQNRAPPKSPEILLPRVPVNESVDVATSFGETPSLFHLQLSESYVGLEQLMTDMNEFYGKIFDYEHKLSRPQVGDFCAAKYSEDGLWYRARVSKVTSGGAEVVFVDYGNSEIVGLANLKVLQSQFTSLPCIAIPCTLAGLPTNTSEAAAEKFIEKVTDCVLVAQFQQQLTSFDIPVSVKLIDTSVPDKDVDITDYIISAIPAAADKRQADVQIAPITPVMNSPMECIVSFVVSPGEFYCQLASESKPFDGLMNKLYAYYGEQEEGATLTSPTVGAYCAAPYSDGSWYRGRITAVDPTQGVSVHYIDYGNTDNVEVGTLHELAPEFCGMPAQALECQLSSASPAAASSQWSGDATEKFQEFVLEKTAQVIFVSQHTQGCFEVQLSVEGKDATQLLVEASLARMQISKKSAAPSSAQNLTISPYPATKGSKYDILVTFAESPHEFYCQVLDPEEKLDALMTEIHEYCQDPSSKSPARFSWKSGDFALAQFSDDQVWYRSRIVRMLKSGTAFEVHYIDYGNSEVVPSNQLRPLKLDFCQLPCQALKCRLNGSEVYTCSKEKQDMFSNLILNNEFSVLCASVSQEGSCAVDMKRKDDFVDMMVLAIDEMIFVPKSFETKLLPSEDNINLVAGDDTIIPITMAYPDDVIPDSYHDVTISHVESPSLLFCQFSLYMARHLEVLMSTIQEHYTSESTSSYACLNSGNCKTGRFVAAQYSADDLWYRAALMTVQKSDAEVYFIDYGNREVVPFSRMKPLNPEFAKLPAQAIPCCLAEVAPSGGGTEWSDEATEIVFDLVNGKSLVAQIKGRANLSKKSFSIGGGSDGEILEVSLIDSLTVIDVELVSHKLAVHMSPTPSPTPARAAVFEEAGNSKKTGLTFQKFSNGQICEASVSHIESPSSFWIQMPTADDDLAVFNERLATYYMSDTVNTLRSVSSIGSICCARYSEDQSWYRGVIKSTSSSSGLEVCFVDYGNSEVITPSDVKVLGTEFQALPVQAIECKLHNCLPLPSVETWSDDAIGVFSHLVLDKDLSVKFVSQVENVWEVEVCYEGEDVTTQLLHTGLVAPIESEVTETSSEVTVQNVIPTVELQSGHTYPVYIAFNDAPNKFYCQLVSDSDRLESLMAEIADFYNGNHLEPLIEVGAYCVAQYSGNSAWYRAKILSIDPKGEVEVHFIDYGNSEYVSSNQILALESRFASLPAQAFCCSLIKNVADVQFNSNVMDAFISIDLNQEFNIKVTGLAGDRYLVNLYDQNGYFVNDSILGMYDRVEDLIVQPAPPVQPPPPPQQQQQQQQQQQVPPAAPQPIPPSQHHPPPPPPQQIVAPMDLPVGERSLAGHEHRKEEYTQLKYRVGQTVDVYISNVESPTSFYCQPLELTADLENMMNKLGDVMSNSSPQMQLDPANLTPGRVCIARYSADTEWYRAKIEGEVDGGIMVTFVDYGNYEVTTPECIARIPPQFLSYSVQAIHCSVFEGLDASMDWSPEQVTQFQNLIPESDHLTLKVCGLSSEQYYVEICNNGEKMEFSSLLEQHIDQVSAAAAQPQIFAQHSNENPHVFKPIQDELPDFTQSSNAAIKTESESENGETESDTGSEGKPLIKAPFKLSLAVANESVSVSVVYVQSPSLLYVQRVDCQAELTALSDEIEQYCSSFGGVEPEFPQPFHQGDFVLAKFAEDGLWYRAEVIGVDSDGTAKVTFIDYGNQEVILPKDLMMCPENLLELPVQAIPCCLAEVPRRESDSWPPSYKELIDSLVTDKVLKATVSMAASQGMMSAVDLLDTEGGVKINDCILAKLQDECEMSTSDIIAEEPEPEGEIPDDVLPIDDEIEAQPASPPVLPTQDLLQPGTSHDVYVIMCTGPESFICQLASASEALESIATKLSELYTSSDGESGGVCEQYALQSPPSEGDFVVALFSADGLWYRARVTKVCEDGKSCEVLFVDYGNVETVVLENLCIPDASITTHPPLAFECYLTGVEMPASVVEGDSDDLLAKVAQEMTDIVGEDICTAEIVTVDNLGRFGVALTKSTTGRNVASLLIQAELVSPSVPQTSTVGEETEEKFVEALTGDEATAELQLPEDENLSSQEVVVLPTIEGLDPGTTHNVFVMSCTSPRSFVCQLADTTELLDSISAEIGELYATVGVGYNLYTLQGVPKVGDFVVALFSGDQQWYRAKVRGCSEEGQSFEVVFIDYGNSDVVSVENVRKPDPSLAIHPPLAFECFLDDIERYSLSDEGLEEKATERMTEIVGEDSCAIDIVRVDGSGHFGVILKILATEESVGALLIEAKLASSPSVSVPPTETFNDFLPCEGAPDSENFKNGSSKESVPMGEFPAEKIPAPEEDIGIDGKREATSDGLQELKTTKSTTPPPEETTSLEKDDVHVQVKNLDQGIHKQPPSDPFDLQAGLLKQNVIQLPKREELPPASTHEVYMVSCASPTSFVCQLSDSSDALDSVTTLLAKLYSTEDESKSYVLESPPREGDFVVALFSQDQEWYRAVITKLSDDADAYQVLFIDFGNSETVALENLRSPDPSLAIYPPLAFQCFLSGLEPHSSDQDEIKTAAVGEFTSLIDDKSCTIEVLTVDSDGRYGVVLTTSTGVNVGSSLIAARLASPLVPTPSTLQSGEKSTTLEEINEGEGEGEDDVTSEPPVRDQDTTTTTAETADIQVSSAPPSTAVAEDLEEPLPLPPSDVPSDAPLEIATSFTKLSLEVGQQYLAEVITVATLEEFVCRVATKEKELGDLMDDIGRQGYVFGEEDALTVSVPKKGLPVSACSMKDSCWRRAEIDSMGHEPNSIRVTYVDHGNTETLSLDRVRHLKKRFADALPTLCVSCSLPVLRENDLNPLQFAGEPWELMWPIGCIKQFAQLTDTKRAKEDSSGLYLEVIEASDDGGYVVKVIKRLASGEEVDIREALIEKLREPKKIELDDSVATEDGTVNDDDEEALLDAEVMKAVGDLATHRQGEAEECVYSVSTGDETVTLRTRTPTPQPTADQDREVAVEGDQAAKPTEMDGTCSEKPHEISNDLDGGEAQNESGSKRLSQNSLGSEDEWADAAQDLTEPSTSEAISVVAIPDVPLAASELVPAVEASREEEEEEGGVGESDSETVMELVNGNGTREDVKPCLSDLDLATSGARLCYADMTFTVGQELELVLSTGLNPSNFSCQLHSNAKLLDTLMADIECTASDLSDTSPSSLSPGQLILARLSTNLTWYRAQVVTFEPAGGSGSAEVLLVDYGRCERLPLTNIRRLPEGFITLPKQAITCSLTGVKPAVEEDSKWRPEAMEKLKELAGGSEFMTATVVRVSEANIIEVSLRSGTCEDFSKALVEAGVAVS